MNGLFEKERVYTLTQVAATIHVSRVTLSRAAQRGELKAFRAGKQWRVLGREVMRYLNPQTAPGADAVAAGAETGSEVGLRGRPQR
jgi:excisionase family DNA binding protein